MAIVAGLLAYGILLFVPSLALAQRRTVEQFVRAEMQQERIPGVAFAVYGPSGTLLSAAQGFANVELGAPASTRTLFKSGSVAKEFVAVATRMLADEGRLSIEDPVTKYLPEAPPLWSRIALKHLLSLDLDRSGRIVHMAFNT